MKISNLALAMALLPVVAFAQEAAVPVQAVQAAPEPETYLPAGTTIPLRMTQMVTTKGDSWKEGDQFNLAVATNVMLGDYIVIPEGTKAVGRITWLTSRGAFGKSGKMDIELEYLQLGNRRVNIDGTYRQEGNGATLATVGGVIAAGIFAGFITGKSGVIPEGRELNATLEANLPVALPKGASLSVPAVKAATASPVQAEANVEAVPAESEPE
ncbi:hypothetical protein OIK40_11150 [Erythrobacter sp. sf7]|uniref:Uncharacterized protein n=1 Tax=Erythrobacter fulvus TaxID=2987523 RepID=A0ABT5JQZ7_9SPHN|nr:hypothetical protein [Erythrobacter fulvus]MDC8755195.1 hypothetical protein [Erythrobacter fulvus]